MHLSNNDIKVNLLSYDLEGTFGVFSSEKEIFLKWFFEHSEIWELDTSYDKSRYSTVSGDCCLNGQNTKSQASLEYAEGLMIKPEDGQIIIPHGFNINPKNNVEDYTLQHYPTEELKHKRYYQGIIIPDAYIKEEFHQGWHSCIKTYWLNQLKNG